MSTQHPTDEKIALWKWLADTCQLPGNQWEYKVLYEAAHRRRYEAAMRDRQEFEAAN
jgi:hypothetical protein